MAVLTRDADRLYKLMPVLYRQTEEPPSGVTLPPGVFTPQPLRQLLALVTRQANVIENDIWQLWDNFSIETCDAWVVPYIGELVGNALLHDASRAAGPDLARQLFADLAGKDLRPPIAIRTRADVAKTIYYRRRKGTLPMLEELARDVTGWAAHVVAMFEQLEWTQHLEHLRLTSHECPDLRRSDAGDRISGPFDFAAHAVDVRPIGQYDGWYNIRNVAFFLWRLRSYPLMRVRPHQRVGAPWSFTFSPLGNPAPLFTPLRREGDESGLATERHVPAPIRPAAFHDDLVAHQSAAHGEIYGDPAVFPECSVVVVRGGAPVAIDKVRCHNLDPWPAAPPSGSHGDEVWIDVHTGRIAFGSDWTPLGDDEVDVSYYYGFASDLGGGPYERGKWLIERNPLPPAVPPVVYGVGSSGLGSIAAATAAWVNDGRPNAIISIAGNTRYAEPIDIDVPRGRWLAIEAATGSRPHIVPTGGVITVTSTIGGDEGAAAFTLSGLLVEGGVIVDGDLSRLRVIHSTLVPGHILDDTTGFATTTNPSITVNGGDPATPINTQLHVEIAFSIVGPMLVTEHAEGIWLLDSIVDGVRTSATGDRAVAIDAIETTPAERHWAPPATIERCTLLGRAFVAKLDLGSNSIFAEPLTVEQRVSGCARFSWIAPGSRTPRRHRCQPASENQAWLVPSFTALRYGLPGYGQLRLTTPREIRTGAEDGSEMGVFCHLKQPQRQTNLRIRLDEYLPLGLVPGVVFVT